MPAINRIRMFFKLFALSEYCHSPYFADLIEIVNRLSLVGPTCSLETQLCIVKVKGFLKSWSSDD